MIPSSASTAGDSRPTALDKSHPTTGDCGSCHTTTPTFAAHVTTGAKPTNHIPTNAPCAQCHTTAGNYAAYVMGATGHTGITTGCAQCHATGLTFANMAPPTLVEPPTGPTGHIPVGSLACELCHSPTNFSTFSGTVMKHTAVRANACDSCHEYGMAWKTNTGVQLWVRPSPSHHKGLDCGGSGCHTSRDKHALRPTSATAVAAKTGVVKAAATGAPLARVAPAVPTSGIAALRSIVGATSGAASGTPFGLASVMPATGPFNHQSAAGATCVSCHSRSPELSKPPTHIATSDNCQACHTTLAWLPVRVVDHTQVKGLCANCHNGRVAAGKPSRHISATNSCEMCHTTNAWTPARFDHEATAPHTCINCHNAVQAIGLPRNHVPTALQCDSCHGTLAWLPAKLDHSNIAAGCPTCHNGTIAVGKPAAHMSMQRDCSTCHSYPDWSLIRFKHISAAYPGEHRAALSCVSCHTSNSDQVPYPSAADAGSCGACHAAQFKPDAHVKTAKGDKYTASELKNCSGACHIYSDATRSSVIKNVPGPHHRISDATFGH